jgi:hypothetical protein
MRFRARLIVQTYRQRGDGLNVRIGDVDVTVREAQHPRDQEKTVILAEASTERIPPPDLSAYLSGLDATPASEDTPEDVLSYCAEVARELSNDCRRVVELVRWRWRSDSPHSPYVHVAAEFSADGERWLALPARLHMHATLGFGLVLNETAQRSVQKLIEAAASEPLAHQLLREAKDVAGGNPRSALVVAVAAVESGFKHLVADLVPDAGWLAENVPSPPVVKMLKEFLPLLPVRLQLNDTVLAPPKYVRTLLTEAVEDRNRVMHTGRGQTGPDVHDQLHETLTAIQDTLYLFDYYAGHAWALEELTDAFREALGT